MTKYFAVTCKCGHVGRSNYILITFPVIANDAKEAARVARWFPRCKHHHKDCVRDVKEITFEEYISLYNKNKDDPYIRCTSKSDQRLIDLSSRIIKEDRCDECHQDIEIIHKVYKGKIKIKKPKKYIRYELYDYSCVY